MDGDAGSRVWCSSLSLHVRAAGRPCSRSRHNSCSYGQSSPRSKYSDMDDGRSNSPRWQQTPNMAYPRAFHNLTLLPDGSVVATGGGSTLDGIDYANSVLAAEL